MWSEPAFVFPLHCQHSLRSLSAYLRTWLPHFPHRRFTPEIESLQRSPSLIFVLHSLQWMDVSSGSQSTYQYVSLFSLISQIAQMAGKDLLHDLLSKTDFDLGTPTTIKASASLPHICCWHLGITQSWINRKRDEELWFKSLNVLLLKSDAIRLKMCFLSLFYHLCLILTHDSFISRKQIPLISNTFGERLQISRVNCLILSETSGYWGEIWAAALVDCSVGGGFKLIG